MLLEPCYFSIKAIYRIKHTKGKSGAVAVKINLDKAYDRLKWSFIRDTLHFFHFPQPIIDIIINCLWSTPCNPYRWGSVQLDYFFQGYSTRGSPLSLHFYFMHGVFVSKHSKFNGKQTSKTTKFGVYIYIFHSFIRDFVLDMPIFWPKVKEKIHVL